MNLLGGVPGHEVNKKLLNMAKITKYFNGALQNLHLAILISKFIFPQKTISLFCIQNELF